MRPVRRPGPERPGRWAAALAAAPLPPREGDATVEALSRPSARAVTPQGISSALRPFRRQPPRVRHHPPGYAVAVDQLPGHRSTSSASSRIRPAATRCYRDARLRRLTRYRYNNVPADSGGRYLYLRDNDSAATTGRPRGSRPSGTSTITSAGTGSPTPRSSPPICGIRAETLYFVPPGETLEVWRLRLTQRPASPPGYPCSRRWSSACGTRRTTRPTSSATYSTGEVEVDGGVIYHTTEYRERRDHFAYFACSEPLAGFDTQRETFLGAYRGWDRPAVVERGESGDSIAHGWSPHGSHHVRLALAPGETREVIFLLGYWENPHEHKFDPPGSGILQQGPGPRRCISRWLRPATVAEGFAALRESWASLLSTAASGHPRRRHQPDGQHLEPVPVHGHVQHEPVGVLFESGIGPRHGLPRLQPGPARLRAR